MSRGRQPHAGLPVGSTHLNREGYAVIKVSASPHVWMLAHRWAMEQKLGRKLSSEEPVHHACLAWGCRNGRACFDPEHLELVDWGEHTTIHQTGRKQPREQVEHRNKALRKWWRKPGVSEYRGALMLRHWQDPEYRARQSTSRKAAWGRRKADPAFVHNCTGVKRSPESGAKVAKSLRAYWAKHRSRAVALAKARWADPAYREKQRVALLARWARSTPSARRRSAARTPPE